MKLSYVKFVKLSLNIKGSINHQCPFCFFVILYMWVLKYLHGFSHHTGDHFVPPMVPIFLKIELLNLYFIQNKLFKSICSN